MFFSFLAIGITTVMPFMVKNPDDLYYYGAASVLCSIISISCNISGNNHLKMAGILLDQQKK